MMKKAVLVVSFGVSHQETRKKTIAVCEQEIKQSFAEYDFFRAYTSHRIIEKIKKKEQLVIDHFHIALENIYRAGYVEVLVQPLYVVGGEEFNQLKWHLLSYEHKFKKIQLGRPLLTYMADYIETVEVMKEQLPQLKDHEALIFMGHGTANVAQAAYCALEYVLRDREINAFVGTLTGYPGIDQIIKNLELNQGKTVILMPFLLVTGYHVMKDMKGEQAESWKNRLEIRGYEVQVILKGLGEYPGIRKQFINHAHQSVQQGDQIWKL